MFVKSLIRAVIKCSSARNLLSLCQEVIYKQGEPTWDLQRWLVATSQRVK